MSLFTILLLILAVVYFRPLVLALGAIVLALILIALFA